MCMCACVHVHEHAHVQVRGNARKEAERHQRRVARLRRDALRELLRAGARRGVLPWGHTSMAEFAVDGMDVDGVVYIDLDEELP